MWTITVSVFKQQHKACVDCKMDIEVVNLHCFNVFILAQCLEEKHSHSSGFCILVPLVLLHLSESHSSSYRTCITFTTRANVGIQSLDVITEGLSGLAESFNSMMKCGKTTDITNIFKWVLTTLHGVCNSLIFHLHTS